MNPENIDNIITQYNESYKEIKYKSQLIKLQNKLKYYFFYYQDTKLITKDINLENIKNKFIKKYNYTDYYFGILKLKFNNILDINKGCIKIELYFKECLICKFYYRYFEINKFKLSIFIKLINMFKNNKIKNVMHIENLLI